MSRPTALPRSTPSRLLLPTICIAQFLVVLDTTVVSVALPHMRRDLQLSPASLQWIINAYMLTFAGLMLLGGRAADLYGRRRLLLTGLFAFVVTSLLCGLAQNGETLIAGRAAQGIGAAVLSPATLTILTTSFREPRARIRALGIWSAMSGTGGAIGVLAGGLLTGLLNWRWIFLVNVPIGLLTTVAAWFVVHESRQAGLRPKLDYGGAFTITGGLAALVYGIVNTGDHAWTSTLVLVPTLIGLALLVIFVAIESHHPEPLVPLRLLASRTLVSANLIMVVIGTSIFSGSFFLSQYLQDVLGYGPTKAGIAFLPLTITVIVGAQLASRSTARLGVKTQLIAGLLTIAVGLTALSNLDEKSSYLLIVVAGCTMAIGFGFALVPATIAATSGFEPHDAGLASGVVSTARQIGGSVGLAALATIASVHARHLRGHESAQAAQSAGYDLAFLCAAAAAVVAAIIAAVLVPRRIRPPADPEPASATFDSTEAMAGSEH